MNKALFLLSLVATSCFGQNLVFNSEYDKSHKKSDYKSYVSKDSIVFNLNENVKIGSPSELTFKYIYKFHNLGYLPMTVRENRLLDGDCKIIAISVAGSDKKGYLPYLQIQNENGLFFSIEIENAISIGEVKTRFSENEILEILKKDKEKLELGIISEEEFAKRKKELLKQKD